MRTDITFNLIYVGGTVEYLLPFVHTLLEHEPACHFRLVANGCSQREETQMASVCQQYPTLSFMSLNARRIQAHGAVLTCLQQMEQSPYFAIMDTDIFAVGPFMEHVLGSLERMDALFSCRPIRQLPEETIMPAGFTAMAGRLMTSFHGFLLGGTFFAVYRNEPLTRFLHTSGVTFRPYRWGDLPPHHQETLERLQLRVHRYDTGKVLNILMQHQGCRMGYEPLAGLVHLGAFSRSASSMDASLAQRSKDLVRALMPSAVRNVMRILARMRFRGISDFELAHHRTWNERTIATCRFFDELLSQDALPDLESAYWQKLPPEIRRDLRSCGEQVLAIYSRYGRP